MKYKTYKKTTNIYEDIFSQEKETKEIAIEIGDTILNITEHQYGRNLCKPQIHILTKDGNYSMDFDCFINKLIK